jgi:uncharacterized protein YdeI (YjbR/CyaY-like superfamily)
MKSTDKLPITLFENQQDWERWLAEHYADAEGIWLKLAKKATGIPSVNYSDALDSTLCYGWIDGQKAAFDDQHWLQKFTPRRPKSIWSKMNCDRAMALIAQARMQPAGLKQIELAKADGRWDLAYASQSRITIPADFQSELDRNPQAKEFFSTLDRTNRYAILFRIHNAKKTKPESLALTSLSKCSRTIRKYTLDRKMTYGRLCKLPATPGQRLAHA